MQGLHVIRHSCCKVASIGLTRVVVTSQPVSSLFFSLSVLHCPLGLGELQAWLFPDVVFPSLFLSALSSSPFHCALQDGFGHASLYDGQVFVWSDCLLDLGTDFLTDNVVESIFTICFNSPLITFTGDYSVFVKDGSILRFNHSATSELRTDIPN